jgi:hypothetical protein
LEWENSKVACAALSIPYGSTLLMQGTQYPTCNLVMPQLYQMITSDCILYTFVTGVPI